MSDAVRACPCDELVHPPELRIPAGLETVPRQLATFPQFRRAMLARLRRHSALADWRARHEDDLGVMLLELWAYVCDSLAFYDETIAHEAYVRTARLRPSLRKLVGLLGYVPRPAVGATAWLAVFAEGRQPLALPAGTAFRSGAFDDEPPQVFELEAPATVHPLTNEWPLAAPRATTIGDTTSPSPVGVASLLFAPREVALAVGDIAVVSAGAATHVRRVAALADVTGSDGERYVRVELAAAVSLPGSTLLADAGVARPTQTASLWTLAVSGVTEAAIADATTSPRLTLDSLYRQIKAGALVVLARGDDLRWFRVASVSEAQVQIAAAATITVSGTSITTPAVTVPVTRLLLDAPLNDSTRRQPGTATWSSADAGTIVVHHALEAPAHPTAELRTRLAPDDPLVLVEAEAPEDGTSPERFLFQDRNGAGLVVGGGADLDDGTLILDQGTDWSPDLPLPARAFGNVVRATRGETVAREVLGSGDASAARQSFALKKKPLTYVPSPGAAGGVASTLRVWVDGVRWSEVPTFFGAAGDAQVYVVREREDGAADVIFGDGVRGARLPTGRDNVVAGYRFGAGEAAPPAASITQLARPVKGLTSVRDPLGAAGGADAEPLASLRRFAPRSALLLGRAVSIHDLEAAAAAVPGVRAIRAEWRWHDQRQRAVAQVWYVGESGVETLVSQALRAISDPATPIDVDRATGVPTTLALDVVVDARRLEAEVLAAVRAALMEPGEGLLSPERIGIGRPLYRSRIFATVLGVPGVESVRGILWDGAPFTDYALDPGAGAYFDLEAGSLEVVAGG